MEHYLIPHSWTHSRNERGRVTARNSEGERLQDVNWHCHCQAIQKMLKEAGERKAERARIAKIEAQPRLGESYATYQERIGNNGWWK